MTIPFLSDATRQSSSTSAFTSGGTPAGTTGQVQYNNAGAFGGASDVKIENGVLRLEGRTTTPANPAALGTNIFPFGYASRFIPSYTNSVQGTGAGSVPLQTAIWDGNLSAIIPNINSATTTVFGGSSTVSGTATARAISGTSFYTRQCRAGFVSAAPAGSFAGVRISQTAVLIGNNSNLGGFFWVCRFGISDATLVANARTFVGVSTSTAAPTNVEPSTLTNCIGFGHGAADTTLRVYRGGSTAQTPIDLGANFPTNAVSTNVYECCIYAPVNWIDATGVASPSPTVHYQVRRLNTGNVATGVLNGIIDGTQLPSSSTGVLSPLNAWRTNNTTASAVGLDIFSSYCEWNL